MGSGRFSLGEPERHRLAAGATGFGLLLDVTALDRFSQFADSLGLWSARTSLISCRTASELVERHLLDSLAISPWVRDAATIVDLGSGAGFPGVPLAIAHPDKRLILVEPRRRRANFLREVKRTLDLGNVQIVEARAEEGSRGAQLSLADAVVSRAVWADAGVLRVVSAWLRPSGTLIHMRGTGAVEGARRIRADASGGHSLKNAKPDEGGSHVIDMRLEHSLTYRIEAGQPRALDIYRRSVERPSD